jgi:mannose-6-phosphate isomerase-like protein (cupin superfamily)
MPRAPYTLLLPQDAYWRESNMMKIPNTDLAGQLGSEKLGARLWRLPPYSANTWHRHVDQDEMYFVLEGTGRIRVGGETLTIPRYGAVLVEPSSLRQVFNDTADEVLWLICGAPRHEPVADKRDLYPEDPLQLPPELRGHRWPRE